MNRKAFMKVVESAARDLEMNYEHAVSVSQSTARRETDPGEQVPVVEQPQGEAREWYKQEARDIYDRLMLGMESLKNEEGESIAAAPSQEAVAALQVLAMRDNVGQEELEMYYEQYGKGNYNVSKALDTVAKNNGLNPSYETYEGLDYGRIERDIERMTFIDNIEGGAASPATAIKIAVSDVRDALGLSGGTIL